MFIIGLLILFVGLIFAGIATIMEKPFGRWNCR
jgi:hypothetical protein